MQRLWKSQFWRSAAVCLGGGMGLLLVSAGCFRLQTTFATAGFALLIVITLISLLGNFTRFPWSSRSWPSSF